MPEIDSEAMIRRFAEAIEEMRATGADPTASKDELRAGLNDAADLLDRMALLALDQDTKWRRYHREVRFLSVAYLALIAWMLF